MNLPVSFVKKCQSFSLENGEGTDVTHSCIMTESINQALFTKSIEVLDLLAFKTQPCSSKSQHNYKTCFFYHNSKDRRRAGNFFSSDLCEYAEKNIEMCPMGDFCPKSHNRLEQLYHPDKYKTKFCSHFPKNLQNCEYGSYCSFAHNENEILIDLIHNYEYDEDFFLFHYKTVWCPFNLTQHDKGLCVYAHNWQDFRRKPHVYAYEPASCPNWNHNQIIVSYEEGCPNNFSCTKCHGWKENEFHPLNYRTKPCPNGNNCSRGFACPFFHNIRDKRVISFNILSLCFKFFPRNRIISNTFKFRRNSSTTVSLSKSNTNNSAVFNNLNPVIEESEKDSNIHKLKKKESYDDIMHHSEDLKHDTPCFSTPSKRNINMSEVTRKWSDSVPLSEKLIERQFFMSQDQDHWEKLKNDEFREFSYNLFGKSKLKTNELKQNNEIPRFKLSNDELSNSKDDDFSDLVEEINKMTNNRE